MRLKRFHARALLSVAIGLVLMWLTVAVTVEGIFSRRAPELALSWWGPSADAHAALATRKLISKPSPADVKLAQAHAQQAIERESLSVAGARNLALVAAMQGQNDRAGRMMFYAASISRRDLGTHLWMIEHAVARNDIPAALAHYDRALRTTPSSWAMLLPILAKAAASEPEITAPLAALLEARPPWWAGFVEQLLSASQSPAPLFALVKALGLDVDTPHERFYLKAAVRRLADLKGFEQAFALYSDARNIPLPKLPLERDGDFESSGDLGPVDWTLVNEDGLTAVKDVDSAGTGGSALYLSVDGGREGVLAGQLLRLAPGAYRLSFSMRPETPESARPNVALRCAGQERVLLNRDLEPLTDAPRRWSFDIAVAGAGCPYQQLWLSLASSELGAKAAVWIDDLSIVKLR